MSLEDKIAEDFKHALKGKDAVRLSILRMVRSGLKNKEVELRRKLDDEDVLRVLASMVKQVKDSIEQFQKGGRTDLADKETAELAVLESYLPRRLDDEEILSAVREVIAETGASGMKDLGRVMKIAMQKLAGKADGKKVNEAVKSLLSA